MALRASVSSKVGVSSRRTARASVKPVAALSQQQAALAAVATVAAVAGVAAPAEAANLVSTVASAASGYPFVPPAWAPSVLVPLTGLVFPAIAMATLFVYIEKERA